jgi:hypothetical protein
MRHLEVAHRSQDCGGYRLGRNHRRYIAGLLTNCVLIGSFLILFGRYVVNGDLAKHSVVGADSRDRAKSLSAFGQARTAGAN